MYPKLSKITRLSVSKQWCSNFYFFVILTVETFQMKNLPFV